MSYKNFKPGQLELINRQPREPVQPPRLLALIQKNTLAGCEQLLAHLFSATDDLFYDLSKRASSNNEQNLYFEAMREIRIKREGIANEFLRGLSDSFSHLLEFATADTEAEDDASTLSIVEGDDLEVDLAKSNMVSRTRDIFKEELHELSFRLDHLLLQIRVNENNNPLDPKPLTENFIAACQGRLEAGIKAKLILFKLFEKHLLKQLGHIYADANQVLVQAGIVPKVPKSPEGRVVHGGAASTNAQPAGQFGGETHHAAPADFQLGLDTLNLLLASARQLGAIQQPTTAAHHQTGSGIGWLFISGNPGPLLPAPDLTQRLTQRQIDFAQPSAELAAPRNSIAEVVQQLLSQDNPQAPHAVAQNDENVINLVAMFFDQILEDESLPFAVQSLICRMQIPILKVALRDRSFFSNPEHPARKLVNTLTEAGLGFEENKPLERDPLFRKMTEVVDHLNRQYKADERIFSELLAELERVIMREKRKSTLVEERTAQAEAGKSRIKQARAAAQAVMYDKLKDAELPETIKAFLTEQWLQVMIITYLKQGVDSTEWISNEQTVSDLIWISKHHDDVRSQQRRDRLLPELLDRIESALEVAVEQPDLRASRVAALEQTILAIHGQSPAALTETFTPLNEEQKEALGKGENAPKTWQEMSAVERQKARYDELSSQYFEQAMQMPEGSWLIYHDEDTDKKLRCKLTSKLDVEAYIFVNRLGFKVLEKSRKQFAYDLQFNRARPIDTRPLFDRAMKNVVGHLEHL